MFWLIISFIFKAIGWTNLADSFLEKHRIKLAKNAQNEVTSMSDAELDKRVQSDITRK